MWYWRCLLPFPIFTSKFLDSIYWKFLSFHSNIAVFNKLRWIQNNSVATSNNAIFSSIKPATQFWHKYGFSMQYFSLFYTFVHVLTYTYDMGGTCFGVTASTFFKKVCQVTLKNIHIKDSIIGKLTKNDVFFYQQCDLKWITIILIQSNANFSFWPN